MISEIKNFVSNECTCSFRRKRKCCRNKSRVGFNPLGIKGVSLFPY